MNEFKPKKAPVDRPPENPQRLMIGKVAALYGITVQTLRYYDKTGLFRPEVINPDSGYRYYSIEQLRQLEYILFLRRLDFSLSEIETAMEAFQTGESVTAVLEQRCTLLQKKIDEMQKLQRHISSLTELAMSQNRPCNRVDICYMDNPRHIRMLTLEAPLPVSDSDFSVKLMEYRRALLNGLPTIQSEYSMGAIVSASAFSADGMLAYDSVTLDPGFFGTKPSPGMEPIPPGYFASVRFHRSETQPEEAYRLLLDFVEKHSFTHDDRIFEFGLEASFSSISRLSELTELQLRIHLDGRP